MSPSDGGQYIDERVVSYDVRPDGSAVPSYHLAGDNFSAIGTDSADGQTIRPLYIRASTHTGRPLATDSILSKLEHKPGRRLRPLPVGRPRKVAKRRDDRSRDDRKWVTVPTIAYYCTIEK